MRVGPGMKLSHCRPERALCNQLDQGVFCLATHKLNGWRSEYFVSREHTPKLVFCSSKHTTDPLCTKFTLYLFAMIVSPN